MADDHSPTSLGPNAWLVEEMHERFLSDPASVSASWQEFFADYRPPGRTGGAAPNPAQSAPGAPPNPAQSAPGAPPTGQAAPVPTTAPVSSAPTAQPAAAAEETPGDPIRGVGARIVTNMEASLAVPTATSFR